MVPSSGSLAWKLENKWIAGLLGANVADARHAAGLSQHALAREARLHRTEVGQVERGGQLASLHTLLILGDVLDVPVADLTAGLPVPLHRRALVLDGDEWGLMGGV